MSDATDIVAFENQIVRWDLVPAQQLLANPKNPRTHPKRQRQALVGSLKDLGIIAPVLVNLRTGFMIDGHARVEEIVAVDPERPVPVAFVDLTAEQEAKALAVFDRITGMAEVDKERLEELLREVRSQEPALQKLLADMAKEHHISLGDPGETAEDPGADLDKAEQLREKWGTELGQIWQVGRHRIACGDCRDTCCLEALMHGRRAEVLWTDPPYGVSYVGKTKDALTIENDGAGDLATLLGGGLIAIGTVLADSGRFYIAAPAGPQGTVFRLAIEGVGWKLHQVLVWVKDVFVLGHSDYHYQHEDVLYGFKPGPGRPGRGDHEGSRWYGGHDQSTVFQIPRPKRSEQHPTQKPVELISRCLLNSTQAGDPVLDPFSGSGSTIVACEQTGRAGFGMDVDPRYVAVTLERLAGMGLTPELDT